MATTRRLSDFEGSRDNNFTLIRLVFAWLVLFGHAWSITRATGADPISQILGGNVWAGSLAVNGFFAISGYLVMASYMRQGPVGYVIARALRIWPGAIACILLSVFVLGWHETTLSTAEYFGHGKTWSYLGNVALWPRISWELPGVFESHHYTAVNGSLWTLSAEISCYLALLLIGFSGGLRSKTSTTLIMLALLLIGIFAYRYVPLFGTRAKWDRPAAYFILGVLVWTHRESLPLNRWLALGALAIAAGLIALSAPKTVFHPLFALCFVYLIFYVAYALPHVAADKFPGDISYGIYIYAFPCQQLVAYEGQNPYENAALGTGLTLILALLSWYGLERRALLFKKPLTAAIEGALARTARRAKLAMSSMWCGAQICVDRDAVSPSPSP